ncbi:MAG: hypothetical protein K2X08_01705, partial [Chlamydiales bacterium]|nr:hypothetical protein [Chlamydiales bacterium]
QAKTLFATHYWELTRLEKEIPGAVNYQVAVEEVEGGIVFMRKIIPGGTDKSYGIHVAKLAGLPLKAIKRAEMMLRELETKTPKNQEKPLQEQLSLFTLHPPEHPALTSLKALNINMMTPLQALQKLTELQELLANTPLI